MRAESRITSGRRVTCGRWTCGRKGRRLGHGSLGIPGVKRHDEAASADDRERNFPHGIHPVRGEEPGQQHGSAPCEPIRRSGPHGRSITTMSPLFHFLASGCYRFMVKRYHYPVLNQQRPVSNHRRKPWYPLTWLKERSLAALPLPLPTPRPTPYTSPSR
jgi:hypothetical protein